MRSIFTAIDPALSRVGPGRKPSSRRRRIASTFLEILNCWVRVDDQKAGPQVSAAIEERFTNSSAEVECQSERTYIAGALQMYTTVFRMVEAMGLAVVIAIGLVAANTAAMSIRERRPEVAIMRSIGFSGRTILSLLLAESLIIALAGGLIGCGAAFVVLKVFSVGNLVTMEPIKMPPIILLESLVAAALIGVLSAYIPARAAVRRNVAEALRLVTRVEEQASRRTTGSAHRAAPSHL